MGVFYIVLLQEFVYRLVTVHGLPGISVCFLLSCRDVVALLTPGGAIPARRYTFSTDVGLRHPVMEQHASFRAGSSLLTCVDLSHTGHAYSAVEYQSERDVVVMVAGLAPHFVFDGFLGILFQADVLHFSLCMPSL